MALVASGVGSAADELATALPPTTPQDRHLIKELAGSLHERAGGRRPNESADSEDRNRQLGRVGRATSEDHCPLGVAGTAGQSIWGKRSTRSRSACPYRRTGTPWRRRG
ncbi:hypothetical protein [Streptomyces bauhiniae]|uniref:hypothetical protein n=1 Tax=Streptomyces bauhiniae TaxID=2340725 RepID=UPI0035DC0B21